MFKEEVNRFVYVNNEGQVMAYLKFYALNDNAYDVNSVYADISLRGKGIGQQLVDLMVNKASQENMLIRPTCPYVLKLFVTNDKYENIWYKE